MSDETVKVEITYDRNLYLIGTTVELSASEARQKIREGRARRVYNDDGEPQPTNTTSGSGDGRQTGGAVDATPAPTTSPAPTATRTTRVSRSSSPPAAPSA